MRALASLLLLLSIPSFAGMKRADPAFSGARAFSLARKIVAFGPRPSGSPQIVKLRRFILETLARDRIEVELHRFQATPPAGDPPICAKPSAFGLCTIPMVNIIAKIPGESPGVVILAGHYDTKRFTDGSVFVGANDGGSSTAALLEAAHVLAHSGKKKYTTWIVFHDGEESQSGPWSSEDSLHGSRRLAAKLKSDGTLANVRALINIDMIGGKDLYLLRESSSTPWLNDLVRSVAIHLGKRDALSPDRMEVEDDHSPYFRLGVPSVNLIDLTGLNKYWHKPADTIDQLSPVSFGDLGAIAIGMLDALGAAKPKSPGSSPGRT